eukprot:TRINITY_DN1923_c0_g1_i2.p1 TRINITY_DN1923_c0_g1~~TRINITY_DN1923_c0_g1_i2.p1  ORF type:complete len:219 (-),score=44.62 TRINITY_DN1923_c0_g1_i2:14-670(-)
MEIITSALFFAADVIISNTEIHAKDYHLVSCDLNHVDELDSLLTSLGIDFEKPTMIISECVLVYMQPEKGTQLIHWAASKFSTACFVTYEQINPHDAFGEMMVKNLAERGCALLSIHEYADEAKQAKRYEKQGWHRVEVLDMSSVYYYFLPTADRLRIERIELFDELEEWNLIQRHYCIVWAMKDSSLGFGFWGHAKFEELKKNSSIKLPHVSHKFFS